MIGSPRVTIVYIFVWILALTVSRCQYEVVAQSTSHDNHGGGRSRCVDRTVHARLRHSLQYHPDFQLLDWDRFVLNHQQGTTGDPPSLDESTNQPVNTTVARHTQATSHSPVSDNSPPLTLHHARIIHEHAMEATHGIMRSYGHITAPRPPDPTMPVIHPNGRRITPSPPTTATTTLSPIDYGADPMGRNDSTLAFDRLIQDLLQVTPGRAMAANITNLGGVTIDLQGGHYLISEPIRIPPFYGNIHIMGGSLQASTTTFPKDHWLIEIGNDEQCQPVTPDGHPDPQKSCTEFVDVTNVLLDANFVAAGGIRVSKAMGTTLHEVFVTGFVQAGIQISNGHEVMISNAWLAECYWSTNAYCRQVNSQSIGIVVDGMDHYITNTIVFDYAKVGVSIHQPANLLVGVHTWNGGGHGIDVQSHTIRLIGCYLDFETLNLWNPRDILVESTFFYYGHTVLHASGQDSLVDGLVMRFNHYNTNQSVILDGTFDQVHSVSIQDEVGWVKTTKASRRLTLSGATEWTFDFTEQLLFPTIDFVSYSVVSTSSNNPPGVSYMVTQPNGTLAVTVMTSEPMDATVYVTVEQGGRYDS